MTEPASPHASDATQAEGRSPRAIVTWMAARNPVFKLLACEILHAERGHTRLAMPIGDNVINTFGAMHGGMIFAFADLCFGFTANAAQNVRGVSSSGEIHWLAPGIGGDRLIGDAHEVWREGRNGIYHVYLTQEGKGDTIAIVHGRMRFIGGPVVVDDDVKTVSR
ncbi:MAG: hotdog fold thioesterase [Pseudomonadota bacterium]